MSSVCQVLRSRREWDLADLFLVLHQHVRESGRGDELALDRRLDAVEQSVAVRAADQGALDAAWLETVLEQQDDDETCVAMAVLGGLDDAFAQINPRTRHFAPARSLKRYLFSDALRGRLNASDKPGEDGALLFRLLPSRDVEGAARPFEHAFDAVVAVKASTCARLPHRKLGALLRADGRGKIKVACAPLLGSVNELHWGDQRNGQDGSYTRLAPKDVRRLQSRIRSVLRTMREEDVSLVVMPEQTLSIDVRDAWQEALQELPPRKDRSQWMLIGSGVVSQAGPLDGSEPPMHVGVLMPCRDIRPETTLEQPKCRPFDFSGAQLKRWRLDHRLTGERVIEDILPGDSITIAETSIGRVAILMTQDVESVDLDALAEYGVTLVLAPVFCGPDMDCTLDAPTELAKRIGTRTVVVNSLVVADAQRRADPAIVCRIFGDDHTLRARSPDDVPVASISME